MYRLSLRAVTSKHLLRLSMLDFPVMLRVKLPVQPQSNKFVTGAKNKGTGD